MYSYRNLLITVEHASTGKMGGIGSYNHEIDKMTDNLLVLLVDDKVTESPAENIILCRPYIRDNLPQLLKWYDKNYYLHGYVILQVVKHLLEQYPKIRNIDTHEYLGVAARVAEAARTGVLKRDIRVRTHAHGGQIQLERATGSWIGIESYGVNVVERSCMENAHELWFSSEYLKELYRSAGVRVEVPITEVLGLPYDLHGRQEVQPLAFSQITNLVFVGRMNKLKGYEVFTKLVEYIMEHTNYGEQINSVVAIGLDDGSMRDQTIQLRQLAAKHKFTFTQILMTRAEILKYESDHANDSLFILPYMSDNYSVAMLELIEVKAPIICLDTGGNRELIDSESWRNRLALNTDELCSLAEQYLSMPIDTRQKNCELLYQEFIKQQKRRNKANADRFVTYKQPLPEVSGKKIISVTLKPHNESHEGLNFDPVSMDFRFNGRMISFEEAKRHCQKPAIFVVAESVGMRDVGAAISACQQALCNSITSDFALSVGCIAHEDDVHLPMYIDLELLAIDPVATMLRNVCLSETMFFDFLSLYKGAYGGHARRNSEYFMAGITYYLVSRQAPVIPIPVLVDVKTTKMEKLVFDEVLFSDLAQFSEVKNWVNYRHLAALRYEIWHGAEIRRYTGASYMREYAQLILKAGLKVGLPSKVVRSLIRAQLAVIKIVVASKRRLF